MEIKRLRILALEIFKTLNNLNPSYLTEMLQKASFASSRPPNLGVNLRPKLQNTLPKV